MVSRGAGVCAIRRVASNVAGEDDTLTTANAPGNRPRRALLRANATGCVGHGRVRKSSARSTTLTLEEVRCDGTTRSRVGIDPKRRPEIRSAEPLQVDPVKFQRGLGSLSLVLVLLLHLALGGMPTLG